MRESQSPEKGLGLELHEQFMAKRKYQADIETNVPLPNGEAVRILEQLTDDIRIRKHAQVFAYWIQILIGGNAWHSPAFQVLCKLHPMPNAHPALRIPRPSEIAIGVNHAMNEPTRWLVPPRKVPKNVAHAIASGSTPILFGRSGDLPHSEEAYENRMHVFRPDISDATISRREGVLTFRDGVRLKSFAKNTRKCEARVYFER